MDGERSPQQIEEVDEVDVARAARAEAAAAIARLGQAFAAHLPGTDVLRRVTAAAGELSAELEAAPVRDKRVEMFENPRWAHFRSTGALPPPPPDGGDVDFDPASVVGGPLNPFSMGARYRRDGDAVVTRATVGPAFEGPAGRVHGGMVAALVDEAMSALLPTLGLVAMTGRLNIRFVAAAPLGVELELRSRLRSREGRRLLVECVGRGPEGVFVEAEGTFVALELDRIPWMLDEVSRDDG